MTRSYCRRSSLKLTALFRADQDAVHVETLGDGGLAQAARQDLVREAVAERAALLYLDLDKDWSIAEIAAQLGMTARQLRHFTRSTAFPEKYQEIFAKVSDDPGPRAAQLKVVERLLPQAMRTLE